MKQPIPIAGSILAILFIGFTAYLALYTNLLVPKHMKDKQTSPTHSYVDHNQVQYDDNEMTEDLYVEEDPMPLTPLFDDKIDLSFLTVSLPATYKNLSVCLIYGKTDLDHKKYLTLSEALKKNLAVVHETQNVNELSLDNKSDQYIYINSGEIVKGGQQDRTIQYDVVVAPHATRVDLASFCVEHGRWSQREGEEVTEFKTSEKMIASNDLKIATKKNKNQSQVWAKVEEYQQETEVTLNSAGVRTDTTYVSLKDKVSESSLELTLENKDLEKMQQEFRTAILQQLKTRTDATGFAYFINGKLCAIDVFNNHRLFTDLFNKLLDAAIAEAITVYNPQQKVQTAITTNIPILFRANAQVYMDEKVNDETQFRTSRHNLAKNVFIFTSFDKKEKAWLHRNWLEDSGASSVTDEIPVQQEIPVIESAGD